MAILQLISFCILQVSFRSTVSFSCINYKLNRKLFFCEKSKFKTFYCAWFQALDLRLNGGTNVISNQVHLRLHGENAATKASTAVETGES